MLKAIVLLMVIAPDSGCGGTKWLRPQPPPLPQTAASECRPVEDLCTLPESMDDRPLNEQSAMIMACHAINTTEYAKCFVKHQRLIQWAHDVSVGKEPRP